MTTFLCLSAFCSTFEFSGSSVGLFCTRRGLKIFIFLLFFTACFIKIRISNSLFKIVRAVCLDYVVEQLQTVGIVDFTVTVFSDLILFFKFNTPLKKQFQLNFHRIKACFHNNKCAFGK